MTLSNIRKAELLSAAEQFRAKGLPNAAAALDLAYKNVASANAHRTHWPTLKLIRRLAKRGVDAAYVGPSLVLVGDRLIRRWTPQHQHVSEHHEFGHEYYHDFHTKAPLTLDEVCA
jgi:hypothetical protein